LANSSFDQSQQMSASLAVSGQDEWSTFAEMLDVVMEGALGVRIPERERLLAVAGVIERRQGHLSIAWRVHAGDAVEGARLSGDHRAEEDVGECGCLPINGARALWFDVRGIEAPGSAAQLTWSS
jgi:hypothetical protein